MNGTELTPLEIALRALRDIVLAQQGLKGGSDFNGHIDHIARMALIECAKCPKCGQSVDRGGEYPCVACGLPTLWDDEKSAGQPNHCTTCNGSGCLHNAKSQETVACFACNGEALENEIRSNQVN